jgi:hypothetical protein
MEGEAHVGTSIIHGVDFALVVEEGDGLALKGDDAKALLPKVAERGNPDKSFGGPHHMPQEGRNLTYGRALRKSATVKIGKTPRAGW